MSNKQTALTKPPLGVTPAKFFNGTPEERLTQLTDAINRYTRAEIHVPVKWVHEYNDLAAQNEEFHNDTPLFVDCSFVDIGEYGYAFTVPLSLNDLWSEFSEIQHVPWMIIDKESVTRFSDWLKTGEDPV